MAITRTPNKYKGFIFDGVDSRDYGIYITDGSVFGAPERDVEMIEIPGRNGAFALDKGRFNNIEVTYSVGLYFDNETDFATAVNSLRNELCSRKGYCRLEDDVNPDEYRMAVYKSGLEIDTNLRSSDFKIVFDCQPQRFLKSGETAQAVTSGGTITNPTLFESHPMLQVWGYGAIGINGEEVRVRDGEIGDIILVGETGGSSVTFPTDSINNRDTIAMLELSGAGVVKYNLRFDVDTNYPLENVTGTTTSDFNSIVREFRAEKAGTQHIALYLWFNTFDALYGIDKDAQATFTIDVEYTNNGETVTATIQYRAIIDYSGDQFSMRFIRLNGGSGLLVNDGESVFTCGKIYAYSTKSALGEPLYFDLDIGEAYKIEGGEFISVNNAVTIPAELPTLKAGSNTITYDNTVTQLKVVPRWWEV